MARHDRTRLTPAEGRKFGLTVGAAFAALGGLVLWKGHVQAAYALLIAGGILAAAGLAVPTRLGPLERAWMGMALAISKITTPVVMSVIYFIVLTPVGLLRRVVGGGSLRRDPSEPSHWIERGGSEPGDLQRQF